MKMISATLVVWTLGVGMSWAQVSVEQLQRNTIIQQERARAEREREKAQRERAVEVGRSLFGTDALWMGADFHDPLRDKSPSDFQLGDWGCTNAVFRIVGPAANGLLIVPIGPDPKAMLLRGVDVAKATRRLEFVLSHPVVIPETYTYRTVRGDEKTVLVVEVNKEKVTEEVAKVRAAAEAKRTAELAAEKAKQDAIEAAQRRIEDAKRRTWTSADAKYKVVAKFVTVIGSVAVLERDDGKQIQVSLDHLSKDDQEFIRERKWLAHARDDSSP